MLQEQQAVIEQLRSADADVIALQEIDVGCERSGSQDTGTPPVAACHSLCRDPGQLPERDVLSVMVARE